MEARPDLKGYVLAGGLSSRMGRDKALLELGGRTLLERAAEKLRAVCGEVAYVGPERPAGRVKLRHIEDNVAGCGPIGGIEAALRDAGSGWVVFLPVDMPLLPVGMLREMVKTWTAEPEGRWWAGVAEVDGVAQPLLSAVRCELLPEIEAAVSRGEYKVMPAVERAARDMKDRSGAPNGEAVCRVTLRGVGEAGFGDWKPGPAEIRRRHLWFANLNTAADFAEAEVFGEDLDGEDDTARQTGASDGLKARRL